jgi:hypothetical protein
LSCSSVIPFITICVFQLCTGPSRPRRAERPTPFILHTTQPELEHLDIVPQTHLEGCRSVLAQPPVLCGICFDVPQAHLMDVASCWRNSQSCAVFVSTSPTPASTSRPSWCLAYQFYISFRENFSKTIADLRCSLQQTQFQQQWQPAQQMQPVLDSSCGRCSCRYFCLLTGGLERNFSVGELLLFDLEGTCLVVQSCPVPVLGPRGRSRRAGVSQTPNMRLAVHQGGVFISWLVLRSCAVSLGTTRRLAAACGTTAPANGTTAAAHGTTDAARGIRRRYGGG